MRRRDRVLLNTIFGCTYITSHLQIWIERERKIFYFEKKQKKNTQLEIGIVLKIINWFQFENVKQISALSKYFNIN